MEDKINLNTTTSSNDINESTSNKSDDENNIKVASIPGSNKRFNRNNNFSNHGMQIFKTALPYLDSKSRRTVNMIVQVTDLLGTVKELQNPSELSICEVGEDKTDTEAMLMEIKNISTPSEREFIDILINFYKAKSLYNTYKTLISSSSSSNDNARGNLGNMFGFSDNSNMFEMLMSFIPPEQKSTFETLSMMMSTMSTMNMNA
jgi:hypothetical protein